MDQQGKPDGRKVQSVPHTVQGAEAQLPPVLSRLPKWARIWWVWAFIGCLLAAGGWYGWQDRPSSNDLFAEAYEPGVPLPRYERTIRFDPPFLLIMALAYSQSGRYLAIFGHGLDKVPQFVIYDLVSNAEISRFKTQWMYDVVGYGWGAHPIWLANDTVLEFGARGRWNPMTGEVLPNHPTLGWSGGYNWDFSKLLTVEKKTTGEGVLHIYDTQTWWSQDIAMGGLRIPSAAWTADDRIIAFVHPWVGLVGKQFDGYVIGNPEDVGLRLLDYKNGEIVKAKWFPAVRDRRPGQMPYQYAFGAIFTVNNFPENIVAAGHDQWVDGNSLEVFHIIRHNNPAPSVLGGEGGEAFSPDGRYLFIKQSVNYVTQRPVRNNIVDVRARKEVGRFGGGDIGIAITSDGHQLALGNTGSVQIYNILQ